MNLFKEEKGLFLKIANVILFIWALAALVVCYSNLINLIMPEPLQSYDEYKAYNCYYYETDAVEGEDAAMTKEEYCPDQYESYKVSRKSESYYNKRYLLIALGNVVIVSAALVLLNKEKKTKKN